MSSIYLVLDMENDLVYGDGPNGNAPYIEQARARRIAANTRRALSSGDVSAGMAATRKHVESGWSLPKPARKRKP